MSKELFDDLIEWARAADYAGCGIRERGDHYWAENWEGRNCGEFYPSKQEGYLDFG